MIAIRPSRRGLGIALAVAVLSLIWITLDREPETVAAGKAESAMTVRIDPEHGIVPLSHASPPPATGPMRSLDKSSDGVEIVEHPNGMRSAVLHEGFMSTSVARIGEDGRAVTDCLDSSDEVEAYLAGNRDADGLAVR